MLGVIGRLADSSAGMPADVYLATVDDETPVAAAMITPPFRLVLTDTNAAALRLIVDDLQARSPQPLGVLGASAQPPENLLNSKPPPTTGQQRFPV